MTLRYLFMSAQITETMTFTQIIAILTSWEYLKLHLKLQFWSRLIFYRFVWPPGGTKLFFFVKLGNFNSTWGTNKTVENGWEVCNKNEFKYPWFSSVSTSSNLAISVPSFPLYSWTFSSWAFVSEYDACNSACLART